MKRFMLSVVLFVAGCSGPASDVAAVDAAHNSRNALDWAGSYSGMLPCADCEGILTTVSLRDEGTFERELVYVGKEGAPVRETGRFAWNEAGSIVTLALPDGSTQMYQVGENQLFHLDRAGQRMSGELASRYVLRQALHDARIENRKWLLVEVRGRAYVPAADGREASLVLDAEKSVASGNNSCNNFFGGYVIEAGQRIRFAGNLAATRMACPDMTTEQAFMEALGEVDNYAVDGNRLSLNRARMAPLLRFELAVEAD